MSVSSVDPRMLVHGSMRGRTALVTGAGSGIGRAIALRLAELGATVIGLGRREEALAETWQLIAGRHCEGTYVWRALDVRDRPAATALVAELAHAGLDLLVNNAGGQYVAPAVEISQRGMAAVLDLNLTAAANLIAAARPALARARGTVVTLTLSSPERGIPGLVHAAVARAAITGVTGELAQQWAADGISLYCLAPGTVLTDGVRAELTPAGIERALAGTPLGRDTDAGEVAEWVAALAGGVCRLASGSVLALDGGAGVHGVAALGGSARGAASIVPGSAAAGRSAAGARTVAPGHSELALVPFSLGGELKRAASGELAEALAAALLSAQDAVGRLADGGSVLFVVSGDAARSEASMRAISALARTLALEWAPRHRVNADVCDAPASADALATLIEGPAGRSLTGTMLWVS